MSRMRKEKNQQIVKKWKELEYGMFIHVGLYSVLGGVYKNKPVTRGYSEQILSHARMPQYDYENIAKEFTFHNFDADKIAQLAKDSQMNYIVITAKHHDGFCLFNTHTTPYNTMNTPFGKDVVALLSKACEKHGIKLGIYFSWIDWHLPEAHPISEGNSDPIPPSHQEYNIAQLTELLTQYGEICELWMDMGHPTLEQSKQVYNLAHHLQPSIMVNSRVWNDQEDFLTMSDNALPTVLLDTPWQTPASIYQQTWGYRSWQKRENLEEKIKELALTHLHVIETGGNYLLNIGLTGSGEVVEYEKDVLLGIGKEIVKNRPKRILQKPQVELRVESNTTHFPPGEKMYQYTGAEYYTFHPIITGVKWLVHNREKGSYSFTITSPSKIETEVKLAFTLNDTTSYFTFQKGEVEYVITEGIMLDSSSSNIITIHTVANENTKVELFDSSITLIMKKSQ